MFKIVKSVGVLLAALLIVLGVSATTLMAAPPGEATLVSSPRSVSAQEREWTPERMVAAIPYPLAVPSAGGGECAAGEPTGPPSVVPGYDAGVERTPQEPQIFPEIQGGIEFLGYPYPPPFTRHEVFPSTTVNYKKYPYKTVGVLFFTQNGVDYRCSASSIGNYAIWTAGHCVSDGAGSWSTNMLFVPGYLDGAPLGPFWLWTGSYSMTFNGWHSSGILCWDMGGVVLNRNNEPVPMKVSQRAGALGFAFNFPRGSVHWFEVGYPSQPPFNGNRMIMCASSHSRDDNPGCASGAPTVGAGCDQTPGCSGGPWIMDFLTGNYLNGNFSYHYLGLEGEKFSPYFNDNAFNLRNTLISRVP